MPSRSIFFLRCLFPAKKTIFVCEMVPVKNVFYGKGNQVEILNSTRCCKSYLNFLAFFVTVRPPADGKTPERGQVRKPAVS